MTSVVENQEKIDLKDQVINEKKLENSTITSPTSEEKDKLGSGGGGGSNLNDNENEKSPLKKSNVPTVHKIDYVKDKVYLYQFTRCPTIASASPFCLKLETFIRAAGIDYENVDHKLKYKSKKGQLPFIELNGKEIADSDIIIKELSEKFDKNLDKGLTDEQRVTSHAFESMLNNHTSWVVRWWRYNNPKEFLEKAKLDIKQAVNSVLPKTVLTLLFKIGFKSHVKQAIGHGLGRHTTEEIYDFGKQDLKSLSQLLGNKEYFFGNELHLLDIVAFAHVAQFIYIPFAGMDEWIRNETPNLIAHVERIKNKYWPDWDRICNTLELNTHLYKEGEEPPLSDAEKKALEDKKAKEEAKKLKEEAKKAKAEQKRKEKEEREKKKAEEAKKKQEKEEAERKKANEQAAAKAAADGGNEDKKEEGAKPEDKKEETTGDNKTDDKKE